MPTYIRFTLLERLPENHRKQGILTAAANLRDYGDLPLDDDGRIRELLDWFNMHLKIPPLLSETDNYRALSWFKPEALKPLDRMWELKSLLEKNDIHVEVHKTRDPGVICYSDGWQIVAKPKKGQKIS